MDTRIASGSLPDVVMTESKARPTPTPARVPFSQVLAASVSSLASGAQTALSKLPGSPIQAAAVRGASAPMQPMALAGGSAPVTAAAEGPAPAAGVGVINGGLGSISVGGTGVSLGGTAAAGSANDPNGSISASMQQMADENLYYLQVQQQVDAQNRVFTTLSNVLKTEHDSDKAAINNIHS